MIHTLESSSLETFTFKFQLSAFSCCKSARGLEKLTDFAMRQPSTLPHPKVVHLEVRKSASPDVGIRPKMKTVSFYVQDKSNPAHTMSLSKSDEVTKQNALFAPIF